LNEKNKHKKRQVCIAMSKQIREISGDKIKILGASIGNCVHIAGVANFLRLAEAMGIKTLLLGPAVAIDEFLMQR
jgi:predicted esterase YcpF (UPF0227 family)